MPGRKSPHLPAFRFGRRAQSKQQINPLCDFSFFFPLPPSCIRHKVADSLRPIEAQGQRTGGPFPRGLVVPRLFPQAYPGVGVHPSKLPATHVAVKETGFPNCGVYHTRFFHILFPHF